MQSAGNSICEYVVSDTFNKAKYIYIIKCVRIIIIMILVLCNIILVNTKMHTTTTVALSQVPCYYVLHFFKYAYSLITLKILQNKDLKKIAFWSKMLSTSLYTM